MLGVARCKSAVKMHVYMHVCICHDELSQLSHFFVLFF